MKKKGVASGVFREMNSMYPFEFRDQPSKPGTIQRFRQKEPLLQTKQGFKDYVSRVPNYLRLYGQLISDKPKRPGLCQKEAPHW
jgi:hypothetical protein